MFASEDLPIPHILQNPVHHRVKVNLEYYKLNIPLSCEVAGNQTSALLKD